MVNMSRSTVTSYKCHIIGVSLELCHSKVFLSGLHYFSIIFKDIH